MTNLVNFRGPAPFGGQIFVKNFASIVTLVLVAIFALTGCKKEAREDSASFYFDANQEVFFEYGQSKEHRG